MDSRRTASPLARLAAAFEDGTDLLSQAVAVLRSRPDEEQLERYGVSDPADLPLGAADRGLLAAYEEVGGVPLDVTASCAACGARTTLSLTTASVGRHPWASLRTGVGSGLREPTYADLLAAGGDATVLLDRCRLGASDGAATLADLDRAEQSLAGPLHSACAECGEPVAVEVDVVSFVLRALARVCAEFDREVHLLASTYGWDLPTIESLPDPRRQRLAALVSGVA
ncbi:MAG: hypothetical protein ABI131_01915 [Nostocoides sp.]